MSKTKVSDKDNSLTELSELAGKYLIFKQGDEEYGVQILKVHEIIGMMRVTSMPNVPQFVKGVINLRGKIIPVIDLRMKLGMQSAEYTERTCIIVIQIMTSGGEMSMGIIVDEVSEVEDVLADQLEHTPNFGTSIETNFILGVGKIGDRVVMLLDIEQVLNSNELGTIQNLATAA